MLTCFPRPVEKTKCSPLEKPKRPKPAPKEKQIYF